MKPITPSFRGRLRRTGRSVRRAASLWLVVLLTTGIIPGDTPLGLTADTNDSTESPLSFTRVHVPRGRIAEVDLGSARYVPMAAADFEAAVRRLGGEATGQPDQEDRAARSASPDAVIPGPATSGAAGPGPAACLDRVSYLLTPTADQRFAVTASFDVVGVAGSLIDCGSVLLERCRWQSVEGEQGRGEADVDIVTSLQGGLQLRLPGPGGCVASFTTPAAGRRPVIGSPVDGGLSGLVVHAIPLLPALASDLVIELPPDHTPLVDGEPLELEPSGPGESANRRWKIALGPRQTLELYVRTPRDPGQRIRTWSRSVVGGATIEQRTRIEPVGPWRERRVEISVPSGLVVTRMTLDVPVGSGLLPGRPADPEWSLVPLAGGAGMTLEILLPPELIGLSVPLLCEAVQPEAGLLPTDRRGTGKALGIAGRTVPLLVPELPPQAWAGGGIVVDIDPLWAIIGMEAENLVAVNEATAMRWPLPAERSTDRQGLPAADPATAVPLPGRMLLESQAARQRLMLTLEPRRPEFDVARVTMVDVSPGVLLGSSLCDVRVQSGVAFELRGQVTPGWFIDSVEPIGDPRKSTRTSTSVAAGPAAGDTQGFDWRVIRGAGGDELLISLPLAAAPGKPVSIRINGHRAGIPAGTSLPALRADMVRLDGEAAGMAWLEFRSSPETTVEVEHAEGGGDRLDPRVAALSGSGGWRARVPVDRLGSTSSIRFLRQRPPIEVRTQIRMGVRDDRLNESFTFECQPLRADIDAVVVRFTQPMPDLEWSLLPPQRSGVFARRLASDEQPAAGTRPDAQGWLVEFTPPIQGPCTLRAARSSPFSRPVAVPLAWIEGAVHRRGELVVRSTGTARPTILNHRLLEVPSGDAADVSVANIAEFAFDLDADRSLTRIAAAELVPTAVNQGSAAGAWAWRETVTSWCQSSGMTEEETVYEIENAGRSLVTLNVAEQRTILEVAVNGSRLPLTDEAVRQLRVPLPALTRSVELVVRTQLTSSVRFGTWSVDQAAVAIDLPVLRRSREVLLPPDVVAAGLLPVAGPSSTREDGWLLRLFGGRLRGPEAGVTPTTVQAGFRRLQLSVAGRRLGGGIRLAHRSPAVAAVVALVVIGCLGMWVAAGRRPWAGLAIVLSLAVLALWLPHPWDQVCRWAWLAAAATLAARFLGPGWSGAFAQAIRVGLLGCLIAFPGGDVLAAEPLRVFFNPIASGEMALVPEPLYRVLAQAAIDGQPRVRLLACRLEVPAEGGSAAVDGEPWRLELLVDADMPGPLILDQGTTGSRYAASGFQIDDRSVDPWLGPERRTVSLLLPAAGRHAVSIPLEPARSRWGDVAMETVSMPAVPGCRVVVPGIGGERPGESAADALAMPLCEWSSRGGPYRLAVAETAEGQVAYATPRADRVRLLRAAVPGVTLQGLPAAVESRNDLFWDLDACRLRASFSFEHLDHLLPAVELEIDPRLVISPEDGVVESGLTTDYDLTQVRPGRLRVDRRAPLAGPFTIDVPLRFERESPVGRFDLPEVWVVGATVDRRSVRVIPAAELDVDISFPTATMAPAVQEALEGVRSKGWRTEVTAANAAMDGGQPGADPIVSRSAAVASVSRRRSVVRAAQQLRIEQTGDLIRMQFQARLEAAGEPLVQIPLEMPLGTVIERCRMAIDEPGSAGLPTRETVDSVWFQSAADRITVVAQRPATGRHVLEIEAWLRAEPLPQRLPVIRALAAETTGVLVTWDRDSALEPVVVGETDDQPAATGFVAAADGWMLDLTAAASPPRLKLKSREGPTDSGQPGEESRMDAADAPPVAADATEPGRAERIDCRMVIDDGGRVWGGVRFDLMPTDPLLRIQLPSGLRLFEAFVDGRPADSATPVQVAGRDSWEIRLHDIRWPRSVVVIFAGELGEPVRSGTPFTLEPPAIVGLPARRTLWSIHVPDSLAVRVAEPARLLGSEEAAASRAEAARRMDTLFDLRVQAAPAALAERFAALRLARQQPLDDPSAGWRTVADRLARAELDPAGTERVVEVESGAAGAPLTLRLVRQPVANHGRAAASVSLLVICGILWSYGRQRPARLIRFLRLVLPWLAMLAGASWLGFVEPMWPGGLLLLSGSLVICSRWAEGRLWNRRGRAARFDGAGRDETITIDYHRPVGSSSVTRTVLLENGGGPAG
jgi:hypothetical protein